MFNIPNPHAIERLIGAYCGGLLSCGVEPEAICDQLAKCTTLTDDWTEVGQHLNNFLSGLCASFGTKEVMPVVVVMVEPERLKLLQDQLTLMQTLMNAGKGGAR